MPVGAAPSTHADATFTPQGGAERDALPPMSTVDRLAWMDRGACVGLAGDQFFLERGDHVGVERARAICETCPVQRECRELAVELNPHFGIWGGRSESDRRRLRANERVR